MNECRRPLDPIDADALAAGAEPVFAADAAVHAAGCAACGSRIEAARGLLKALDGLVGPVGAEGCPVGDDWRGGGGAAGCVGCERGIMLRVRSGSVGVPPPPPATCT